MCRLSKHMGVMGMCRIPFHFDQVKSSCSQLRKWWTGERIMETWASLLIIDLSSAGDVFSVVIILEISVDHVVNLLAGSCIDRLLKSH